MGTGEPRGESQGDGVSGFLLRKKPLNPSPFGSPIPMVLPTIDPAVAVRFQILYTEASMPVALYQSGRYAVLQ